MRVFHFLNGKHGLEDISQRRLKIAELRDLNDPFEFLSIDLSNESFRWAVRETIDELSKTTGLHCFSWKWSNPVLWSHYADKHRGLCLGFEVPDEHLIRVSYTGKRLAKEMEQQFESKITEEPAMQKLLATKFAHWRYESEMRCFVSLENKDHVSGLYFSEFSEDLKLVQVIVGARSRISRFEIADALGRQEEDVNRFKARLAFKSFKVVRNRDGTLWI